MIVIFRIFLSLASFTLFSIAAGISDFVFAHNVSVIKIPSAHAIIFHFWFSFECAME